VLLRLEKQASHGDGFPGLPQLHIQACLAPSAATPEYP